MKGQVLNAFLAIVFFFLSLYLLAGSSGSLNLIIQSQAGNMPELWQAFIQILPALAAIFLGVIFFIQLYNA